LRPRRPPAGFDVEGRGDPALGLTFQNIVGF
jgi:hypothetical protein